MMSEKETWQSRHKKKAGSKSDLDEKASAEFGVDSELLELLCCPSCKGDLGQAPTAEQLCCFHCQLVFPVVEGIPVMFPFDQQQKRSEMWERYWDSKDQAERYDRYVEGTQSKLDKYVHVGETVATMQVLGVIPTGRFLDCGCGNGRFFDLLPPDVFTVGIDASLNLLRIVRRKGRCMRLVCCELENLPFKSEKFDRILSVRVLQHLEAQQRAVQEMARVCAPGGQVTLNLYNDLCSKSLVKRIRESPLGPVLNFPFRKLKEGFQPLGRWPLAYDKYNTATQVRRWMEQDGLRVTKLVGSGLSFNKWLLGDFWILAFMEKRWPNTVQWYLDMCLIVEARIGKWWPVNNFLEKFIIQGEKRN